MTTNSLADLEKKLDAFFRLFPSLSSQAKNLIVNYGSYFVLFLGILAILTSGLLNFFIPGWLPKNYQFSSYNYYLQIVFNLIAATILILAFKPLREKKLSGWRMVFYLALLEITLSIFTINLIDLTLCFLTFYLLFQVKEKYQ